MLADFSESFVILGTKGPLTAAFAGEGDGAGPGGSGAVTLVRRLNWIRWGRWGRP